MVNFLNMFCPELQKLLKPIYNLTRKDRCFVSEKEQQEAFEEIKRRLVKALILHMPNVREDFIYIQTQVNLLQVVLYINFKMENQN